MCIRDSSYVGTYDMPSHEERIRIRNMSLVANGKPVTGNDAIDNEAAGGGGVDGGIYMTGSYAFETDANCNVVKGTTCLLYTSPNPRNRTRSRMPSSS